jgi:histidine triad (HIT) family protein
LTECIFCRIVRGEAAASVVAETEAALAFMDINQPVPGHVLVIPKAHIQDIYGLDPATGAEVFGLTVEVAKAVKAALHPDGLNLLQANERAGQQDVFHFHVHVIARYTGDRDRVRIGFHPEMPPREALDELADRIKAQMAK